MIGRGQVNSILKYQAIGFDMDHTFVRYKLRHFTRHVFEAMAVFLTNQKKYPQEIFPMNDEEATETFRFFFRAVYDHKNGNLVKIGANGLIMRVFHGFKRLTNAEIIAIYGKNPTIPGYHILAHRNSNFTNLHEFYGSAIVPLLARIVDLKSNGEPSLKDKSFNQLMVDLFEACEYNYGVEDIKKFEKHIYSGHFFPKFLSQPRHYVNKVSPDILNALKKLMERGVLVFLASNSYFHVAEVLLKETIGENWADYFSFAIFNCQKPGFFESEKSATPFQDLEGNPVPDFASWLKAPKKGREKILLKGHALNLNEYLQKTYGTDYQVLFFGDTIVSDCVYSFNKTVDHNWHCVLILEELQELEHGINPTDCFDYWKVWGSALQDKNFYSGVDNTIIFDFADNIAHRSFSLMESKECVDFLTIDDDVCTHHGGH